MPITINECKGCGELPWLTHEETDAFDLYSEYVLRCGCRIGYDRKFWFKSVGADELQELVDRWNELADARTPEDIVALGAKWREEWEERYADND
jgi:hypothetical protein